MPRTPRVKNDSRIYHVMLRGSNRQQIFYDDEDNEKFLEVLRRTKEVSGFELYAYCLMGNHVHLLIKEENESLGTIFRRLGASYVYWYNVKYNRVGHLFQDRYKSEPVNDERYFMTVLRYILYNPVKAGFCTTPEAYAYSSAREYLQDEAGPTDTAFARSAAGTEALKEFLAGEEDAECMDVGSDTQRRMTDSAALGRITEEFGAEPPVIVSPQNREQLNASIGRLLSEGISIRQLSRLTGISKKIIENSRK